MTYLLWQSQGTVRIASPRIVLSADEVPVLRDAQALCEQLAQMHSSTNERLDAAFAESRQRGLEEGLAQGRAAAHANIAAGLQGIAHASAAERTRLRRQIGALALQVARKMLGSFGEDALLAALAANAAQDVLPASQIRLTVHPDRCDAVRTQLDAMGTKGLKLDVRGDAACARDACRLETELGSVDASLDAQLARLAQAWLPVDAEKAQ